MYSDEPKIFSRKIILILRNIVLLTTVNCKHDVLLEKVIQAYLAAVANSGQDAGRLSA